MDIKAYNNHCLAQTALTAQRPFDQKKLVYNVVGKRLTLADVDILESIHLQCDLTTALQLSILDNYATYSQYSSRHSPWTVLKRFGVYRNSKYCNGDQGHFDPYRGDAVFPTIDDLIMSFEDYSKDMIALQAWAILVYGADDVTDLEGIENDPRGEEISAYFWQAIFREFAVPPFKHFLEKCREEKKLEEAKA